MKKNIVFIGGGTGIASVLKNYNEVKNNDFEVSAIISMFDSGGSTGILRKEFSILPMGDVRQVMLSLSEEGTLKRIFEYRFEDKDSIHAHNLGNLIITALRDIEGNEKRAFEEFRKLLNLKEEVVPITWDNADINVKYEDGTMLSSEHEIDDLYNAKISYGKIKKFWLSPNPTISTEAKTKIQNADYIVIGPGDLYLSIMCNFLVKGFYDALNNGHAKIIYIANLVNKRGQTEDFKLSNYISEINKYLKIKLVDKVIYSNSQIPKHILDRYRRQNAMIVSNDLDSEFVYTTDLVSKIPMKKSSSDRLFRGYIRHDSILTLKALFSVIGEF